ncbi:hypothetical protein [Lysobacter gummosus]|uniref:hypothetical protein n=1 Tax=Lysobacter gummosus TaxID=262324 RepID=UPI00362B331C
MWAGPVACLEQRIGTGGGVAICRTCKARVILRPVWKAAIRCGQMRCKRQR